ncbi:hypothetical protein AN641_02050 [Candidatus Epulonipiscioides gigas]|nr:hypothetical protein AN641_02050 [Epulopiscium sp. SCG-C07WGA-EpuloA2]
MENNFFVKQFNASKLSKYIEKICRAFSHIWVSSTFNSIIFITLLKLDIENSIIGTIFRFPFVILENFSQRINQKIVHQSIILPYIKEYLYIIMRINSSLIGSFLLIVSFYVLATSGINIYCLLILLISIGLILAKIDIIELIAQSSIFKLLFKMADFEIVQIDYKTNNKHALTYGFSIGTICIILMAFVGNLLGLAMIIGFTIASVVFLNPVYGLYLLVLSAPIFETKLILGLTILIILSTIARNVLTLPSNTMLFKSNISEGTKREYSIKYHWKLDDIGIILIGLLIMYFLSSIFSFKKVESLTIWVIYVIFIGFYIIGIQLLENRAIILRCIKLFVISGVFVSFYGLLQYQFGWGIMQNWIDPSVFAITDRAYSTLENPNILGVYLILSFMMAIGVLLTRKTKITLLFYTGIVALMALCLGATYSRGCWLGLLIALAIFITFYNGKLWGLAIIALLLAPFILPDNILIRFLSIGNMDDTSTAIRVKIWLSSLEMGSDFALTGAGLGTASYGYLYPFYTYYYIPAQHSHNAFFQIFIEGGIIGFILFIFTIWRVIKHLALCFNKEKLSESGVIALTIMCGIIGFLVQCMFDYPFYNYRIVLIFWLFITLGVTLAKRSELY